MEGGLDENSSVMLHNLNQYKHRIHCQASFHTTLKFQVLMMLRQPHHWSSQWKWNLLFNQPCHWSSLWKMNLLKWNLKEHCYPLASEIYPE